MGSLRTLRGMAEWGWIPALMVALAITGNLYSWPGEAIVPALGFLFIVGLVIAGVRAREREQESVAAKLRQLAGYFYHRFTGNSPLSIFTIITGTFTEGNPPLWEWARSCGTSERLLNGWCEGFVHRLEIDTRTGKFSIYLRTYLNELWLINNQYYEFVEQFREVAQRVELPPGSIDQYNRFVIEYNGFVQGFAENIARLKKVAGTEIEPPSVKPAREISPVKQQKPAPVKEPEPPHPRRTGGIGYYGV